MRIQLDGRNVVAELKLEGERISRYAIADTLPDDTPLTETATEQSRGAVIPQVLISPPPGSNGGCGHHAGLADGVPAWTHKGQAAGVASRARDYGYHYNDNRRHPAGSDLKLRSATDAYLYRLAWIGTDVVQQWGGCVRSWD